MAERLFSSILAWDARTFHWLHAWSQGLPGGPAFFALLTELGNGIFIVLAAAALWMWESRWRRRKAATAGLAFWTYLLSGLLVNLIKLLVGRPRPLAPSSTSFSFPSGHAASAFALAAALSSRWPRLAWLFWLLAALVGLSRVAVGAHYPLDVLAGGALGALTTWGYLRLRRRKRETHAV